MQNNIEVLPFFRIFSVALMAWIVGSETFINFPLYPPSFWQPHGIFQLFDQNPTSIEAIKGIQMVFWIATICGIVGFFSRTSMFIIGLTTMLIYSFKVSFGYMNHRESALIVSFFILCAYPVGAQFSLDALFFKPKTQTPSQESWGLLLCLRVLLCIVYFSAAVSKLMASGWDWVTSTTLQYYLRFCDFTIPMNWAQKIWPHAGFDLAAYTELTHVLAALAILIELAAPLAFVRKLRYPIILGLAILQLSTLFFLKISFVHLTPLFLAWLPWENWFHLGPNAATK